ncbi:MAG: class I SAM-dependent methyltransferase [Acidimicrobiia bacterium]|nr:class I SAM-dependent methyltransferase [Acidimicrobiia bacterium]
MTAVQPISRDSHRTLADVFFRYARPIYDWMYRRGAPWEGSTKHDFVDLLSSGRLFPGTIGPRAIDIGCGIGDYSRLLVGHGFEVIGVDLSPVAIERARSTSMSNSQSPRFVTADLLDLPPEVGGPFDLLVDIGTLDDFPRTRRPEAVNVITSLTRPGSVLYLWCFYGFDRDLPLVSFQGASRYLAPGIEPDELRVLFADGWDIEQVDGGPEQRWASFLMTRR